MAVAPQTEPLRPLRPPRKRRLNESLSTWRWGDRIAFVLCWASGIALCAIAGGIVLYMAFKGLQYLNFELLTARPQPSADQKASGGFLDPIIGTVVLTVIGIVIAIFGLALFQQGIFSVLSFTAQGGAVFGRSFLTAGAMMSLIALPMVFGATREGLQSVPAHVREASYGLGKTKIATIRRVLLPSVKPNISTGAALGMGRIAGDTAIVVVLLGATLRIDPEGGLPGASVLRGTGGTLTSYVYNNSPAGEGNAPQKAYAAAFVLLLVVIGLNFAVDAIAKRGAQTGLESTRLGA